MSRKIAEFAYDLHSGLATTLVPEFDDLQVVGMAATLAVHIKGLGDIDYEVLRKVSDHLMSIPSLALEKVLRLLAEVGFVKLTENGKRIEKVTPNIPVFDDVYEIIGAYAKGECSLNSHEQATLLLLGALEESPKNKEALINNLGVEKAVFDRSMVLGEESGIVSVHKARGRSIVISPYYFTDNLDGLADAAASVGANAIISTLKKVKDNQGWPLSVVAATSEIGGTKLDKTEIALLDKLSTEGVLKPPTIKFGAKSESFIFTPKPGSSRLNGANREIYERAMGLISAVRKGQLLANAYKIKYPLAILRKLRDRGFLHANSEAAEQYQNLVVLRVGSLKQVAPDMWQLHLNKSPENDRALGLAISLLETGDLSGMEVNQDAKIALTKGEEYIQSLISSSEMRKRKKQVENEQATYEYEQLMLKFE